MKVVKVVNVPKFTARVTCHECGTIVDVEEEDLRVGTRPECDSRGDTWTVCEAVFSCPTCNTKVVASAHGAAQTDKLIKRLRAARSGRGPVRESVPKTEGDDLRDDFEGNLR